MRKLVLMLLVLLPAPVVARSLAPTEYLPRFEAELRRLAPSETVEFLLLLVQSETAGNHLVVSRTGSELLCGPVQTTCRSMTQCRRIQRDPEHAAQEAVRSHRKTCADSENRSHWNCRWQRGPTHPYCNGRRYAAILKAPANPLDVTSRD